MNKLTAALLSATTTVVALGAAVLGSPAAQASPAGGLACAAEGGVYVVIGNLNGDRATCVPAGGDAVQVLLKTGYYVEFVQGTREPCLVDNYPFRATCIHGGTDPATGLSLNEFRAPICSTAQAAATGSWLCGELVRATGAPVPGQVSWWVLSERVTTPTPTPTPTPQKVVTAAPTPTPAPSRISLPPVPSRPATPAPTTTRPAPPPAVVAPPVTAPTPTATVEPPTPPAPSATPTPTPTPTPAKSATLTPLPTPSQVESREPSSTITTAATEPGQGASPLVTIAVVATLALGTMGGLSWWTVRHTPR